MSTGEAMSGGILLAATSHQRVLDTARLFIDHGFTQLDSVFTPGDAVWDKATVDQLYSLFVENPDESSADFLNKLYGQIGDGPDTVKQLAAELLTLNLLPVSDLRRETKRNRIETALSWCSRPVAIPKQIEETFGYGVFAAGGYSFWIWAHLKFLIILLRALHERDEGVRRQAIEDPWTWKSLIDSVPAEGASSQQHTLLYLAHPKTFLPIVSLTQKKKIRDAFADYLETPTGDLERDLLQITLALQAEAHGPVAYYQPPLYERWAIERRPSGRRAWFVRGSSVDGHNLVPTWIAEHWVSLAASQLREVEPGTDRRTLKEIVDADYQHKSYAARKTKLQEFDAFLTQMKPDDLVVTTTGGKVYVGTVESVSEFTGSTDGRSNLRRHVQWRNPGRPLALTRLPAPLPAKFGGQADVIDLTEELTLLEGLLEPTEPVTREAELPDATDELAAGLYFDDRAWLQELVEVLRERKQVILYGPPGTGKTYVARRVARHLTQAEPSAVKLVQFHPSYSYEDFFEGYRPVQGAEGTLAFELRPGPMRQVVEAARQDLGTPYILVIDEINRGNVAKVFGELYFLLEYRDESIGLQYSAADDEFTLPPNVFLIATMNTADRSIALIDTAVRRRFAFVPLHPSVAPVRGLLRRWLYRNELPDEAAYLLDALNQRVADRDYAIGPSYFMRREIYEGDGGLERVWRTDIMPLVEELHYGEEGVEDTYGLDTLRRVIATRQAES